MLLKTDVATLISGKAFTMDEVVDLLNDPALLKKALDKYRKGLNKYYMRQSFELAKIMVTGKTQNTNQYLNAHAIYFSKPFTGSRKIKAESVINNIDIYYWGNISTDDDEFLEDLNRIKYIKRLFFRYDNTGELKLRLILNHIIILTNVFGNEGTTRILFYKSEEKYYGYIKGTWCRFSRRNRNKSWL